MLKVDQVSRRFDDTFLWENVSFEVGPSELVSIVGDNGSGKTTLLKTCSGLVLPTAGEVTFEGVSTRENWAHLRSSCACCFYPERSFYLRLTGLQNLRFLAAMQGVEKDLLAERIDALQEMFGVKRVFELPVRKLSLGQRRILAVIIAAILAEKLLFLDEPTATLDRQNSDAVRALITYVRNRGIGVVCTTHDDDLIRQSLRAVQL